MLHRLLENLNHQFPKARLKINATELRLRAAAAAPRPLYTIFNHPANGLLTNFQFDPLHFTRLYKNGKTDLIRMMERSLALQSLLLSWGFDGC
jgi:hypothetical protein